MSTVVMSACWPLQMPPTPKAVLVSLADNANDHGDCWPSIPKICERTCFSERAVQAAIHWLEDHGALTANRENGRHTRYTVTPDRYVGGRAVEKHYVYRITHLPTGSYYIGLRSFCGEPESDDYFGSGSACDWLKAERADCRKDVVQTYASRKLAADAEALLIAASLGDERCLNRRFSNPNNPGGNPRISSTPQEVPPAAGAEKTAKPPQEMHPPPQEVPSNRHKPSKAKATVKSEERVRAARFTPPTETEVADYCRERGKGVDPERWFAHYTSNGWRVGRNPMRDWRAAVRTWEHNEIARDKPHENHRTGHKPSAVERVEAAIRERRARGESTDPATAFG